jgi:hypothetical protein
LALLGREGLWGMIGVEKIGEIRRAYFEQHRSIKEIVRTLSVCLRWSKSNPARCRIRRSCGSVVKSSSVLSRKF